MLLQVSGLSKRYGRINALNGLDLSIESGEFYALLGPSAAGKTTTLRCIAGIERADAGAVHFDGADLSRAPIQGRPMAMVFQSFALYPHLSVYDNLAYPLREAGLKRKQIRARVAATAELLGLTHTLKRKPETASGGEQQRIAIGRALIRQPKLLLLDEPITNLDAKLRHDTRAEFKRLHRDLGMTMLYATPDELEALSMGQRISVINDGRIVQTGTPDELYEQPQNTFVAGIVGSPKMNLLPARRGAAGGVDVGFSEIAGGPWDGALDAFSAGEELLIGFRPQDLSPATNSSTTNSFRATVHLTEPLGDITVLDLRAGDHLLRMVLPEEQAALMRRGDELDVTLDARQSHLFAATTGTAIR